MEILASKMVFLFINYYSLHFLHLNMKSKCEKVILFIPKRVIFAKYDDGLPVWEVFHAFLSSLARFLKLASRKTMVTAHTLICILLSSSFVWTIVASALEPQYHYYQLCSTVDMALKWMKLLCLSAFLNNTLKNILLHISTMIDLIFIYFPRD